MGDVLAGGPPESRRPVPRWLVVLGAAIVAAAVVAAALAHSRGGTRRGSATAGQSGTAAAPATATPPTGAPVGCPTRPDGAANRGSTPDRQVTALVLPAAFPGGSLDRWDPTASAGPRAVVVRRHDGSLGRHSAVITFPVTGPPLGRAVRVGSVSGRVTTGEVNWPIAGARARIRGDLGQTALVRIAAATRVVARRPTVHPPAGYTVAAAGPYRPPHIREVRYGGNCLAGGLGGLVYTGVTDIAGFEDALYATSATRCCVVHGQPAVASIVGGGNGTLAWQAAPGLVGYIGYSGNELTGGVLAALHRLAASTRTIDQRQWRATHPQTISQRNDIL